MSRALVDQNACASNRIWQGLKIQRTVMRQLNARGFEVEEPTRLIDMQGTDFWWVFEEEDGKRLKVNVQFKYRQSGDDLGIEVVGDIDTMEPGRDMGVSAEYFMWVDTAGIGRIVTTEYAHRFVADALQAYNDLPRLGIWTGADLDWELHKVKEVGNDPGRYGEERWKLILYLNPPPEEIVWTSPVPFIL